MKQEEIVNEIRQMCGNVKFIPSLGWHFKYKEQVYFYVIGNDETMIRFCIPFVAGLSPQDKDLLKNAVNETNRNVKFVKTLLSERNDVKVSLDYDHKITEKESAKIIVPHVIKALDFATQYLAMRTKKNNI